MAHHLHPDAQAILTRLKREGISSLYHFSSIENLPGICHTGALCSKQILEKQGLLSTLITGGNPLSHNLDRYHNNWDKVSLNFTPHTPMAYNKKRVQHLCFFLIKIEVAAWLDVIFTDSNAARNDHKRGQGLIGLNNIKFDVFRSIPRPWDRQGWFRLIQAEVLVPERIPLTAVSEIAFVSSASMEYAQHLCKTYSHPAFAVKPQVFTDSPHAMPAAIDFACVKEFRLTSGKERKNMLYSTENKFSKSENPDMLIVAKVNALPGIQGKVLLYDTSGVENTVGILEFSRSGEYWHNCKLSLKDLPAGVYLVKYNFGDVCWAACSFEVIP